MYQPPHFREDSLEAQHALIRACPLGTLVTSGAGGLEANHVPFLIDPSASPNGTLRAHLARANEQGRVPEADALVIFQGPESYVTPSWYATKRETGKVVPTWNYAAVHAWGRMRVIDDAAWLRRFLDDLTGVHESGRPAPWSVGDAPDAFVAAQLKGIVGIEIEIERIQGKWKVSQNRPEADKRGVHDGVEPENAGMAALVAAYGRLDVS